MTRIEKEKRIEAVLARYGNRIGALVAHDDHSLTRLLAALRLDHDDREVRAHLCSYLVA